MAQVVFLRADHFQALSVSFPPLGRHGDLPLAGEVLAGQRVRIGHNFLRRTGGNHLAAMDTGAGTDVNQIVRSQHGILIVFHHQQGVAHIPQITQCGQQLVVVPLVETDRGLIQNIENAHQAGTNLCSQTNSLAFAAGEGSGTAGKGQITKTHGLQKSQTGANLLKNSVCNHALLLGQFQRTDPFQLIQNGEPGQRVDVLAAHGHSQRFLFQAPPLTLRTGALRHHFFQFPLTGVTLGLQITALHIVADALKGLVQNALASGLIIVQVQLFTLRTVEDDVPHLFC